jgi:hypothetical protein
MKALEYAHDAAATAPDSMCGGVTRLCLFREKEVAQHTPTERALELSETGREAVISSGAR